MDELEKSINDKPRKNHWTAKKIDEATKKINQEVYNGH